MGDQPHRSGASVRPGSDGVPAPVLFNAWKHHAGFLRARVRETVAAGPEHLPRLAQQFVVLGADLMDFYTGAWTPRQIADEVMRALAAEGRGEPAAFAAWVGSHGGYATLSLSDDSVWVLRRGDDAERFVHLHPGRWSPQTRRVRANVLKTALLALAYAGLHGGDPLDAALVDQVRAAHLGLPPVGAPLAAASGLGAVIAVLRDPPPS